MQFVISKMVRDVELIVKMEKVSIENRAPHYIL